MFRILSRGSFMIFAACLAFVAGNAALPAQDKTADGWSNLLEGGDLGKHWFTKGNWMIDKEAVVALLNADEFFGEG